MPERTDNDRSHLKRRASGSPSTRLSVDIDENVAHAARKAARRSGLTYSAWISNVLWGASAGPELITPMLHGGKLLVNTDEPLTPTSALDFIGKAKHDVNLSGMKLPLLLTDPSLQDLATRQVNEGISWRVLTLHPELKSRDSAFAVLKDEPYKYPEDTIERANEVQLFLHDLIVRPSSTKPGLVERCGTRLPLAYDMVLLDWEIAKPTVRLEIPVSHTSVLAIEMQGNHAAIATLFNPVLVGFLNALTGNLIEDSWHPLRETTG